ncbi:hypothetical protein EHI8A_038450 [Entamoeba histolytica HM-1:IMSS-B]|uniref:Uncharacterized protein n=3 Tax=Entamoeba histolytica TaxID=5759 RepID=M3UPW1_ENTH1|nr:hypothetical protein EHI8A_038450 [Entamoeba histolytica HM-1:IMSS-B]EMS16526.1 hypothetical protein KM1_078560 [Entamoeba histolytica HM-3:IMSS]ENY64935.1 unknown protein, putative [Entamoeba histolytica HM-1:IMSS-A]
MSFKEEHNDNSVIDELKHAIKKMKKIEQIEQTYGIFNSINDIPYKESPALHIEFISSSDSESQDYKKISSKDLTTK